MVDQHAVLMTLSKLGDLIKVHGTTCTSINPITTKIHGRAQCAKLTLRLTMTLLQLGHVISVNGFISSCISPVWQNSRPTCTDFTFQVTMMPPQLGHVTKIYVFISTFISPITTKCCRMINQYTLTLPGRKMIWHHYN